MTAGSSTTTAEDTMLSADACWIQLKVLSCGGKYLVDQPIV